MPLLEDIAANILLPLRIRNFRLFFIGQSLSLIGTWVHTTAQRWLLYELTNSALYLGLLGAIGSLPVLLFSLPAGYLADHLPKRNLLLLSQSVAMLQAGLLAALVITGRVEVWHVLALAFVLGCTVALEFPVRHSFIYELVGREPLVTALSLHSTAFNLARFLGPALAGFLLARFGLGSCFLVNALSYTPVIFALLSISLPNTKRHKSKRPLEGLAEGLRFAWQNHTIRATLSLIAMTSIFLLPYAVLLPVLVRERFAGGGEEFSFVMAANGLGALCGALFMASFGRELKKDRFILLNLIFLCFWLSMTVLSHHLYTASFCLLLAGFHMVCMFTSANAHLQLNTTDGLRGRILSLFSLSFLGLFPFGSLLSGTLSEYLGVEKVLLLGSSIGSASALFVYLKGFSRRF